MCIRVIFASFYRTQPIIKLFSGSVLSKMINIESEMMFLISCLLDITRSKIRPPFLAFNLQHKKLFESIVRPRLYDGFLFIAEKWHEQN